MQLKQIFLSHKLHLVLHFLQTLESQQWQLIAHSSQAEFSHISHLMKFPLFFETLHLLHKLLLHMEQFEAQLMQFKFWQILHFLRQSGHMLLLHVEHFNIHNLQNLFWQISQLIRQFRQNIFLQTGQKQHFLQINFLQLEQIEIQFLQLYLEQIEHFIKA